MPYIKIKEKCRGRNNSNFAKTTKLLVTKINNEMNHDN